MKSEGYPQLTADINKLYEIENNPVKKQKEDRGVI